MGDRVEHTGPYLQTHRGGEREGRGARLSCLSKLKKLSSVQGVVGLIIALIKPKDCLSLS